MTKDIWLSFKNHNPAIYGNAEEIGFLSIRGLTEEKAYEMLDFLHRARGVKSAIIRIKDRTNNDPDSFVIVKNKEDGIGKMLRFIHIPDHNIEFMVLADREDLLNGGINVASVYETKIRWQVAQTDRLNHMGHADLALYKDVRSGIGEGLYMDILDICEKIEEILRAKLKVRTSKACEEFLNAILRSTEALALVTVMDRVYTSRLDLSREEFVENGSGSHPAIVSRLKVLEDMVSENWELIKNSFVVLTQAIDFLIENEASNKHFSLEELFELKELKVQLIGNGKLDPQNASLVGELIARIYPPSHEALSM